MKPKWQILFALLVIISTTKSQLTCSPNVSLILSPNELNELSIKATDKIIVSKTFRHDTTDLSDKCAANLANPTFNFNLSDCDPYLSVSNNMICFTYVIRNFPHLTPSVPVQRYTEACFNRSCCFTYSDILKNQDIHPQIQKEIHTLITTTQSYDLSFNLFEDSSYSRELKNKVVLVPHYIYGQIKLLSVLPNEQHLLVQVQSCWATPTGNANDTERYDIISNGCAKTYTHPPSDAIIVTRNNQWLHANFHVRAFVWAVANSSDSYFHCKVKICYNNTGDCVPQTCPAAKRRRRNVDKTEDKNTMILKFGPVHIKSNQPKVSCKTNNGGCSDYCSVKAEKVICFCKSGRILENNKKSCTGISAITISKSKLKESNILLLLSAMMLGFTILGFMFIYQRYSKLKECRTTEKCISDI